MAETVKLEDGVYRKSAGLIVVNPEGQILLCERADIKGQWQMPQGGIDEGEDSLAGARRELFEETGLKDDKIELMALHPEWLSYKFPKKFKRDDAIGQSQKWFLFLFKGTDADLKICKTEFCAFKWATAEEAIEAAVDFRKPIYEEVLGYFSKHLVQTDAPEEEEDDLLAALNSSDDEEESDDELLEKAAAKKAETA